MSAKFSFVFISLLKAPIVKSTHILAAIYLSRKTFWTKLESLLIKNMDLSEKIEKVVTKKEKI